MPQIAAFGHCLPQRMDLPIVICLQRSCVLAFIMHLQVEMHAPPLLNSSRTCLPQIAAFWHSVNWHACFQNGRTVQSPYVRKGGLRSPQSPPPPRFLMLGWQTSMQACTPPNPRFFRACSPYREAFRHRGIIPSGACTPPTQQPPRFFKSRACLPHIAACGHSGLPETMDLPVIICSQEGVCTPPTPPFFASCASFASRKQLVGTVTGSTNALDESLQSRCKKE